MRRWEEIKKNNKLRQNLIARDFIIRKIRQWFYNEGFVEVETPALIKLPGIEPYLNPFKTNLFDERGKQHDAYLITSPEYAMKKLLAAGFTKIFQICKCFRNNEPFGGLHNPEFTMLEWYRAGANYKNLMEDVEKMIKFVIQNIKISQKSNLQISADRTKTVKKWWKKKERWERLSVKEAFRKYCNLDLNKLLTLGAITGATRKRGYKIERNWRYEDVFFKIFLNEIEPHLGKERPVFLYDYPIQLAALARAKKDDPRYAERFELYINGIEIANAFSELTDAKEQRRRLMEERALRKQLSSPSLSKGKHIYNIDEDFLSAVKQMPESAGIALGVDRLIMALLDAKTIEEVISFPVATMFN